MNGLVKPMKKATNGINRKGVVWNMLGSAMFGASSVLLLALVSQTTNEAQAGVFSVSFSTAQLLYMIGLFGSNHFQMTDYAERYNFASYSGLKIISSGFMMVSAFLLTWILGFDAEKTILTLLLTLYLLFSSVGELYQSMFFQKNRLDLSGQSMFYRTFFSTMAFAVVILWIRNVYWATAALIVTAAIGFWIWAVRPSHDFLPEREKICWKDVRLLARDCMPLFISVFLMSAIIAIPKYAVDHYLPDVLLGIYSMVFMPVQVINLACSFIFQPKLKTISDIMNAGDHKRLYQLLGKMAVAVFGMVVLSMAAGWLIGTQVLTWFYGIDLTGYRVQLMGVLLGSGLFAYSHLLYYVLLIIRRQKNLLVNYALTTVIALVSSYPMTALLGMDGAIAAFAITHVPLIAIHFTSLRRSLRRTQ